MKTRKMRGNTAALKVAAGRKKAHMPPRKKTKERVVNASEFWGPSSGPDRVTNQKQARVAAPKPNRMPAIARFGLASDDIVFVRTQNRYALTKGTNRT